MNKIALDVVRLITGHFKYHFIDTHCFKKPILGDKLEIR